MLGPLISGLIEFIKRPLIVIPGLVAGIINSSIWYILLLPQLVLIDSLFVLQNIPQVPLIMLPFALFSKYWFWLMFVGINYVISVIVSFWTIFVYSHLMSEKKATIRNSIGYGIKNLGKIIGLSIFFVLLTLFIGGISLLLITLMETLGIIGIILIFIWFLLVIYTLIKLVFLPFIFAIEKNKIRDALKNTWDFTGKHFFMILLLLGVLQIVMFIITQLTLNVTILFEDELTPILIGGSIPWIGFAYSSIVMSKFYLGRKKK